ncbi:MAG TPA: ubiquinone biosynthesis regulatory protein kinase UbiB [Porticoccaceae bacterium]|nr:ubiquinone biosynthesis regulatory protein kinase UbiB [Porticoccaceae bacterium]
MTQIRRALKIIRIVGRYRLDLFLERAALPLGLRVLLAPACLFGDNQDSRGVRLRMALEALGPIFVKFGQLLSTRPDLVPQDLCSELAKLQDNVPPFSTTLFVSAVEKALNGQIDTLFKSFEHVPLASASIAQVHGAVTLDDRDIVIKVVRPDIEKTIREDITLMFTLARWIQKYSVDGQRLHPLEVVEDYQKVILDELNLQSEGANASLLKHNFNDSTLLHVPEILWQYSNQSVLVMERIYATPVTDIETLKAADVNFKVLAERGIDIFFTQVFDHNFFHADMHPGNIFVDTSNPEAPTYLAIDCAIMGSLSKEDQFYMARNLLAIFKRDYRLVAELHIRSGWVDQATSLNEFTGAIRSVCEPIFQRPLHEISMGYMMIQLFDTARRFNMEVQPSLVLLQKTLINVEGLGRQLYPELDPWTSARPFLEQWVRRRYSPKGLYAQLKHHAPDWLEQLPQIPPMIYAALDNAQHKQQRTESTVKPAKLRVSINKPKSLGVVLLSIGLLTANPDGWQWMQQVPLINLMCIGLGALLLVVR